MRYLFSINMDEGSTYISVGIATGYGMDGRSSIHGTFFFTPQLPDRLSRRFTTTAAWVRSQVRSCGICGGQSGNGVTKLRWSYIASCNTRPITVARQVE
jgi:hypothetical protein